GGAHHGRGHGPARRHRRLTPPRPPRMRAACVTHICAMLVSIMAIHHEKAFENELCATLEAGGWLYSPTAAGYDKQRALFPDDVYAWLQQTQPEEWAKVVKPTASAAEQEKAKTQLLDRLVATLDLPLDAGGGTLNVLRGGFKKTPASFAMCAFKPATRLNRRSEEHTSELQSRENLVC